MVRRREDLLHDAMELSANEHLALAEELISSVEPRPEWWDAWTAEAARRYERLESGEDPGLTLDQFWSDLRSGRG